MISPALRKWLAYGTGIGIEMTASQLRVVVVRVRQNLVRIAGTLVVDRYLERPAAEWGAEYRAFLKKVGAGYVAATAVMPRAEIIVRQVAMPGVSDKDLSAAIGFEIDSLHPFPDEKIAYDFCRADKSGNLLVGIARDELVSRYASLFGEAGVKLASLTFSAPVVHSAVRLYSDPPKTGFLAAVGLEAGAGEHGPLEIYGESPSRPVFSSTFDFEPERAASLASADLRLEPDAPMPDLVRLLPSHRSRPSEFSGDAATLSEFGIAYAAALASACPWLAIRLNLLPMDQRTNTSRWRYVPTAVLALILIGTTAAIPLQRRSEDRKYLESIAKEVAGLETEVRKIDRLDAKTKEDLQRIAFLDEYRTRTESDLNLLLTLTNTLTPPTYLRRAEISRGELVIQGETEKADGLLQLLDSTKILHGSDFITPIGRSGERDVFRIRSHRGEGK